ncbi:MAG: hypothetical protein JSV36_12410, partial [Anaerolineae bacterium]
ADLYLWIMDHLHYLRQQYGQVEVSQAVETFAQAHSQRPIKRLVRGVKHALEEIIDPGEGCEPSPGSETMEN